MTNTYFLVLAWRSWSWKAPCRSAIVDHLCHWGAAVTKFNLFSSSCPLCAEWSVFTVVGIFAHARCWVLPGTDRTAFGLSGHRQRLTEFNKRALKKSKCSGSKRKWNLGWLPTWTNFRIEIPECLKCTRKAKINYKKPVKQFFMGDQTANAFFSIPHFMTQHFYLVNK